MAGNPGPSLPKGDPWPAFEDVDLNATAQASDSSDQLSENYRPGLLNFRDPFTNELVVQPATQDPAPQSAFWERYQEAMTTAPRVNFPNLPPLGTSGRRPDYSTNLDPVNVNRREPTFQKGADILDFWDLELYKIHAVEYNLKEGDTLVYIDYPDSNKADCMMVAYSSVQFRVHSRKLIATGSSKFAELFKPTYQYRIQRRRKVVNKLPEGVKYVIDLTPPTEGDELVFQVTELSLTPGIMKWWSSMILHRIDPFAVGGHDDVCSCNMGKKRNSYPHCDPGKSPPMFERSEALDLDRIPRNLAPPNDGNSLPPNPEIMLQMKARGENDIYITPEYRKIPDYCPIRHCNSIIRLLMLIEGRDLPLNSASRVWTMVAISKIFECTSVLRDPVTKWVLHDTNASKFIEVLPEEALQIGFALELPSITQSAFRILVNELAFKEAATDQSAARGSARITAFGRKLGDPGDDLSNLIQHAATTFVERISSLLMEFKDPNMMNHWRIKEWEKLRNIQRLLAKEDESITSDARHKLSLLMKAITHKVQSKLEKVVYVHGGMQDTDCFRSMDRDRASYVEPKDFDNLSHIMTLVNPVQMLLMPFAYSELGTLWAGSLFGGEVDRVSEHLETFNKTFGTLAQDLEDAVLKVVQQIPNLASEESWASLIPRHVTSPTLVDLEAMNSQVFSHLNPIALSWVRHDIEPPLNITRHLLLTLGNNEMKYLPLWAGGCNDGTGGVFEPFLPPAEMGPNGPGPAYRTGHTVPSASSSTGSLMEEISAMKLMGSITAGSVDVHDSISTVYRPDHVIADDNSIVSEAFTVGASDYQDAQFAVPADHQPRSHAVETLVESIDSESQDSMTDMDSSTDVDVQERRDEHYTVVNDDINSEDSMVLV